MRTQTPRIGANCRNPAFPPRIVGKRGVEHRFRLRTPRVFTSPMGDIDQCRATGTKMLVRGMMPQVRSDVDVGAQRRHHVQIRVAGTAAHRHGTNGRVRISGSANTLLGRGQ